MKQRPLPPLDSALRSLWDPGAEPADPFVRWLEHRLARGRSAAAAANARIGAADAERRPRADAAGGIAAPPRPAR